MARTRPSCWSFSIVGQRLVAGHRQVTHPDAGRPVDGVGDGGPSTRPRPTHSSSARTTSSSWPSTACRSSPGTRSPKDATTCSPTPPSARSVPRTASPSLRSCCAGSSVATSSSSPSPFGPTECGRRRRLRLRAPDVGQPSCQQRPGLTVVFDRGSACAAATGRGCRRPSGRRRAASEAADARATRCSRGAPPQYCARNAVIRSRAGPRSARVHAAQHRVGGDAVVEAVDEPDEGVRPADRLVERGSVGYFSIGAPIREPYSTQEPS
jgi:hypothetical protein